MKVLLVGLEKRGRPLRAVPATAASSPASRQARVSARHSSRPKLLTELFEFAQGLVSPQPFLLGALPLLLRPLPLLDHLVICRPAGVGQLLKGQKRGAVRTEDPQPPVA